MVVKKKQLDDLIGHVLCNRLTLSHGPDRGLQIVPDSESACED